MLNVVFFFFSSRRRHTRWPRDWSSDVCSSDLYFDVLWSSGGNFLEILPDPDAVRAARSEERRVGKECRSRWSPDHEKKKIKEDEEVRRYSTLRYDSID